MALPVREHNSDNRGEVTRWDPFTELDRFHRQLGGFLDGFRQLPDLLGDGFTPLADVEETADAYQIEVELPGVKRDHVDIEVAGRRVTVHGERTTGRFHYEVTLPGDVDEDHVDAHLDDGVLTVRLPKPASDRPRRIEIR